MARKKTQLNKPYFMNYWTNRLINIAVNIFKWDNLPPEINRSAMEKSIMLGGYVIFFKDDALETYFALNGALSGVDVYGYPTTARPISLSAEITFNERNVNNECVLIYANKTRTSAMEVILEYADKLSELDLAIKLNTLAMKHPVVIKGTKETQQSFETLAKQYDESYYQLIIDKNLNIDNTVEVLNLGVDAMEILNLQKEKETVLNEFYGIFGVAGSVEKRERVISGEMNATMQQVGINRKSWLDTRKEAVEKINAMYGLNISVDFDEIQIVQDTNVQETQTTEGGKENE